MDINYNELYGLETAKDDTTDETGADAAQEAAQEQATGAAGADTGEERNPESEPEKPEQSLEERARQAEGRRLRVREARARADERARVSATLKNLGIQDPSTGKLIETLEELEAYERGLRENRLREGRATGGDIREVIREEMARAREPERSAETQPSPMETPQIKAELAQIKAMDPETDGDLKKIIAGPYGEKFREYVGKKLSFVEAYRLAAGEKLDKRRAEQAAEAARVQAASKDHLSATGSRGQGALSVPADIMAQYRVFMPDASPEEIQKHYNADRKRYGPK